MSSIMRGGPEGAEGAVVLPPDVVAAIMEYLPYDSILSCSASCRSFLHDALPLLRKLRIDKASEMNLTVASRFRSITDIQINCLMRQGVDADDRKALAVDLDTSLQIVPFLSSFAQLERVSFGGQWLGSGRDVENFYPVSLRFASAHDVRMMHAIDALSLAFRSGALPKTLQVAGLACPQARLGATAEAECQTCLKACRTFPIESVIHFESRGSSREKAESGHHYCLDVCLERSQIEFIAETRAGGRELLSSKSRFLKLLSSGRRYTIAPGLSDKGHALHIVKYTQRELDEMKRVVQESQLDTKKLPAPDVMAAIRRSFAGDAVDPTPPANHCLLSEDSLDALVDQLGICVDKNTVFAPVEDMLGALPQIARVFNRERLPVDHYDIKLDCLRLIRRFLEIEGDDCPIQTVIDLGLVPHLLEPYYSFDRPEALERIIAVKHIMAKGTWEQKQVVLGVDRVVASFISYLSSPDASSVECAVSSLVYIREAGKKEHLETLSKHTTVVERLVRLLDSQKEHNAIVEGSLWLLARGHNDRTNRAVKAGVLPHLAHIMLTSPQIGALSYGSRLLRQIFEVNRGLVQEAIDLGLVKRLAELLLSNDHKRLHLHLSHAVINLANGTTEQTRLMVEKADFVSILLGLIDSPSEGVSKGAMLKIGSIATDFPQSIQQISGAGAVDSLIRSTQKLGEPDLLRTATSTLARCFRGQHAKLSASNMTALSGLLANDDEEVVENTCWALCHMLRGFRDESINIEDVNAAVDEAFVAPIIKLLSSDSLGKMEPAIKSVDIITNLGGSCIESVVGSNGLLAIKELLNSAHGLHEKIRKHACNAVSNIIAGDVGRIQAAIDAGIVSSLIDMLSNKLFRVKKHALWPVYLTIKCGTKAQVEYMMKQGCIGHVCKTSLLSDDSGASVIAVWALKKMLSIAKRPHLTPNAISAMFRTVGWGIDSGFARTVQVIHVKKINSTEGGEERWKVVLSDGTHYMSGMCAPELNGLVHNGTVSRHCIIKVNKTVVKETESRQKVFTIVGLTAVGENPGSRIGAPVDISKAENLAPPQTEEATLDVATIERKLQELMDESFRIENEAGRIELLKKKKVWLVYDQQRQYVESLTATYNLLEEQSIEVEGHLNSFEDKISAKQSLKKLRDTLRTQHAAMNNHIRAKKSELKSGLETAKSKLARFEKSAQERAPKEEWSERLSEDDLPADLAGVSTAIEASKDALRRIEITRRSLQRHQDVDSIKLTLQKMFERHVEETEQKELDTHDEEEQRDEAVSKKRTRSDANDGVEDGDSGEAPVEIPNENGVNDSSAKRKKKKQRGIAAFFRRASGEN